MNNKFLIIVRVPAIEMEFDIYIPNSKKVGAIKSFVLEAIAELSDNTFVKQSNEVRLIDRKTADEYDNNAFVKDTNIRNGQKFILI